MKNRNTTIVFTTVLLAFGWVALLPVAQTAPPLRGEDRGNGNSAAENVQALNLETTGPNNTAHGWFSLFTNTTGANNTAGGFRALYSNTIGHDNTANGYQALYNNIGGSLSAGDYNTATGSNALFTNTIGAHNTANGYQALFSNTFGQHNTATGSGALYSNTTGNSNMASGDEALHNNTTGGGNTASGYGVLNNNSTGQFNTAIGDNALALNTTGSLNTAVGLSAGLNILTASNVTCIGANVVGEDVSNTTWIGNVYGVTTQSGSTAPVIVSADGQLGMVASSERFKKDIATMDKTSEAILSLRPVTFHYKSDSKGTPQFGLIAEEVAKVNPALVLLDKEGKPYTVRYEAVNAMLLNEFLKEHRKVQELEANDGEQQREIKALIATVKEQAARIQKVSAQLEMSKPAPQTVKNTD